MEKIGLGIIGLGYIGQTHLRHSLKLANAYVAGVSDVSRKALEEAKKVGIRKTFTNYGELLKDPDVDSVIIALPTHLHLDCAMQSMEAKKHVFLEKPIAGNSAEAREITSSARKNSAKLMIGYPLRFSRAFQQPREKMASGILGDVEVAYATYISTGPFFHRAQGYAPSPVPEWWFSKELTGGGVLIDLGCHVINLLRWYFGEIVDIKGRFGYRFNLDLEDHAVCLAQFESGTTAVINVGWFSQQYLLRVDLMGSVAHISAQHQPANPLLTATQMLTKGISDFYKPHFAELEYFVNCIVRDVAPYPSGEDGLRDVEAIEQAYRNQIPLA